MSSHWHYHSFEESVLSGSLVVRFLQLFLNIRAVNFDDFPAGIRASQPAVYCFVLIHHAHILILVTYHGQFYGIYRCR